jgi:hypothetical protein
MQNLDFLIIGAQKAGTTSLRAFFQVMSEEVFISNTEHHFWNRQAQYNDGFGIDNYMKNFSEAKPGQLIGEKSPSYLGSYEAPSRIQKYFPKIKLISILRNPAERAYSAYWHGLRVGALHPKTTFSQSIRQYRVNHGKPYGDLVTPGLYSQHISRYLEFFPKNQMLFLDFQQLLISSDQELSKALIFLGLDINGLTTHEPLTFPKKNVARVSRFPKVSRYVHQNRALSYQNKSRILKRFLKVSQMPPMLDQDKEFLDAIYMDEAEKVQNLTGVKFDWNL